VLRVEPQIKQDYVATGQVALLFHHVIDHGASSSLAHRTAECAGAQEPLAFWRIHDLIFERQGELWSATEQTMVALAEEIGLDGATMQACLGDPAIADKVTRLDQQRRDAGIRLRPSFDVDGRIIQGGIPFEQFTTVLNEALAEK
jgi:protein-disulfide isomerase